MVLKKENLFKYQLDAIDRVLCNENYALFIQMGLGKTIVTLTAIDILINEDVAIDKVIVFAPVKVANYVWESEVGKWKHLENLRVKKVMGSFGKRQQILEDKDIDVFVLSNNYNIVKQVRDYMLRKNDLRYMLIIDESSCFKDSSTQRFKALRKMLPFFSRKVILTGTPSSNSYMNLWSQIYILDEGKRLFKFITHFTNHYFKRDYMGYNYTFKKEKTEELFESLKDISLSLKSADYLELPAINYVSHIIELPKTLKQEYDNFKRDRMLALSEDKEITTVHVADLINKLFQFANGALYDKDGITHEIHKEKLKGLKNLIDQLGDQNCLIAYTYKSDKNRILKYLEDYSPKTLEGNTNIDRWNEGKIKVLLLNPKSAGHGLNLQHGGNIIVWFGQTFSLEHYQQFNARLFRKGQTKRVFVYKIIVDGTEDARAFNSLDRKDLQQETFLEAMKQEIINLS